MRKFIVAVSVGFLSLTVQAQESGFGLGVMLGEPSGLSAKLWASRTTAAQFGAAWSFDNYFHVHGDFIMHKFDLINVSKGELPVYFGLGGRLKFTEPEMSIGVRIPVGINYHFASDPFDLFLEVVPILNLIPSTVFDINGAIGFRYFF